ncbi:MAG: PAS domain S-box protein [Armatimonadetes bacterium]|nr:PAS domain S-box protein [Armatimonadota bacterium]
MLGRFLMLQSGLQAAPDESRLADMVSSGLGGVPGVRSCTVVLDQGRPAVGDDSITVALRTARAEYGALVLEVGDAAALEPYLPYVSNTANLVALHLDAERAARELARLVDSLDSEVRLRAGELARSEERFALAMEASQDGVWDWDVPTGQAYFSPGYAAMLGYEAAELEPTAASWEGLLHPDDRDAALKTATDCIEGRFDDFAAEFRMRTKDGGWCWVLGRGKAVTRDEDGRATRLVGTNADISARRCAEDEANAARRLLRGVLDTVPVRVFWKDLDGRYQGCNLPFARDAGFERPDQLVGLDDHEMSWRDETEAYRRDDREVIESGVAKIGFEEPQTRPDGRRLWVRTSKTPLRDPDGTIVGVLGTYEDITDRREAEAALRESETLFRSLFYDHAAVKLLIDPADGRIVDANIAAERYYGWTRDQLRAMTIGEINPMPLEWVRAAMDRVTADQQMVFEFQHRLADGTIRDVAVFASRVQMRGQTLLHSIVHDITERKQAEAALRDSEERYRRLFESNPQPMWVFDRQTYAFLAANGAALAHYGYTADEFRSMTLFDIRPADAWEPLRQSVDALLPDRPESVGVWRHVKRDGTLIDVDIVRHAIDYDGRPAVLVLATDVTERLRAEEERRALERQLQHSQKLESLGVLAGGIAHDFNNLLMAILGNADLALDELSPMSPARDNIMEIERASRRAADLAKQMLAYSGKGRFVVEPIRLGELVEEMAHLLEVSISKKAVLKFNFAANVPTFDGDATQVRQIIMNLITNASEAIGDASGVIALSTGAMECDRAYLDAVNDTVLASLTDPLPEGIYAYVEVADTGCGMAPDVVERIFDPFFTTKFTGRGLGMSAVLGIVRGHKGAIKVYSEPGRGTTFKVLFPANELPEGAVGLRRGAAGEGRAWRGSGTVLIVDDEETVRAVGRRMLERMGFAVLTAAHGREALELFAEAGDDVSCVLLDLTMPHMDGEETFRELRRLRPDVRVMLCSGYNEQDATQRFAGKGLAGFLQKPYSLAALREKMAEMLGGND